LFDLRSRAKKTLGLLETLGAKLENAGILQMQHAKSQDESNQQILSGIESLGGQKKLLMNLEESLDKMSTKIMTFIALAQTQENQSATALQSSLLQMKGRVEELFDLMKAKPHGKEIGAGVAEMAMEAKHLREDIKGLAGRMEHEQHLGQQKVDELAGSLTGRIDELAEKVEGLSAQTLETYMKEILNHLIELPEKILESSERQEQ
ncbi:MAG: hypothetical protein QMD09_08700, partial [Desulfatibacillaceae bacterium]|nr:hypothetical protein [Desulfatibacillaceae bacterium]